MFIFFTCFWWRVKFWYHYDVNDNINNTYNDLGNFLP